MIFFNDSLVAGGSEKLSKKNGERKKMLEKN